MFDATYDRPDLTTFARLDTLGLEGQRVLINDPHQFDGVLVIGVDEHVWRHTRRGDKYVNVIIDLTGIRDGSGPGRRLVTLRNARPAADPDRKPCTRASDQPTRAAALFAWAAAGRLLLGRELTTPPG